MDILLVLIRMADWELHLYYNRNDFNFDIVRFPFLCSNIPHSPVYSLPKNMFCVKQYIINQSDLLLTKFGSLINCRNPSSHHHAVAYIPYRQKGCSLRIIFKYKINMHHFQECNNICIGIAEKIKKKGIIINLVNHLENYVLNMHEYFVSNS
jgi:hypothetical protein